MSRPSVYNRAGIAPFLAAARDRRVSVAFIGDSNTLHATNAGHAFAFRRAWSRLFPMWGSGVFAGNPQNSFPVDAYTVNAGGIFYDTLTLPATHQQWEPSTPNPGNDWPWARAIYTGTPNTTDNGTFPSFNVNGADGAAQDGATGSPLNLANTTINWHLTYATFASGGGVFYPCARQPFTANYFATTNAGVNCQTGTDGLADFTLAIPDDGGGNRVAHGVNCFFRRFDGNAVTGKVAVFWQQAQNTSILNGVAFSVNLAQGGLSTRDAVLAYRNAPAAAKTEWMRQLVRLQNGVPTALFHIIQGQNDTAQSSLSLGPNPAATNTYQGLVDNHEALLIEIRSAWTAAGYDLANLYFLIGPYHPQPYSRKQWIIDADAYLPALADRYPNVSIGLRNERHASGLLFTANAWWEADAPDAHLKNATAYAGNADLTMQQVIPQAVVRFRGATGQTLYTVLTVGDKACDVTNASLDILTPANWTRYALTLTEATGTGVYTAALPATAPPGEYVPDVRVKGGASPAIADSAATGTLLTPSLDWGGVASVATPNVTTNAKGYVTTANPVIAPVARTLAPKVS